MPNDINGKQPSKAKFNSSLLCLGGGRSAFFFASLLPPSSAVMIATEHAIETGRVESLWGTSDIYFSHTHKIAEIKEFIINSFKDNGTLTIPITTDPKRGKQWLDEVLKHKEIRDLLQVKRDKVYVVLIQSPNQYREDYRKEGYNVLQLDFYPGIGNVLHDKKKKVAKVHSGVKESVFYTHSKLSRISSEEEEQALNILTHLCANQEIVRLQNPLQLDLLPTNAILHSVGIITNVIATLVEEKHIDASILHKKTSAEFFEALKGFLDKVSNEELQLMIEKLMHGKQFYKSMPEVGPNVLMMEASNVVIKIREAMIKNNELPASQLDEMGVHGKHSKAHISNHLREKYKKQYMKEHSKSPYEDDFATVVKKNPAYQNPSIVFPTNDDGIIDGDHRFFVEESATLQFLINHGKEKSIDTTILENILGFLERIARISKSHIEGRNGSKPDPVVSNATAEQAENQKDKKMKSKL